MPWRIDPNDDKCVQVERTSGWVRLNCHPTHSAALAQLTALNLNAEKSMPDKGEFRAVIRKVDEERRLVFGWASIVDPQSEVSKQLMVDLQGDAVALDELEASVYTYMKDSRAADEMHERDATATNCIESIVFTPEKIAKLGLEPDAIPLGWWVGFHVGDDEVWAGVKSGAYKMFSIRGLGTREPLNA